MISNRSSGGLSLMAVAAAVSLAACGSSASGSEATGDSSSAPAVPASLTVWVMGDSGANLEAAVEPFVQDTGIEVDVEAIPWDNVNDRLTTAVASGEGPDITQIGLSQLASFLDAGVLEDLSGELADHPNLDPANFPSAVSAENLNPDGGMYSVPWVSDTRVLFYRSDILDEAGISAPPSTWDELRADATTLAARGDGQYGYYIPQWDAPLPVAYTWQTGTDLIAADGSIDVDTDGFRAAVDHYLGFYQDGSVPTAGDFDQTTGFISGTAPMLVSGPYLANAIKEQAPELDGKWDVTTVPADVTSTSLFAGSNLGVWKGTENLDAALQLLDFLTEPATQVAWYQSYGELPAVTAAFDDPALADDPLVAVYAAQLQDSKPLPVSTAWAEANQAILDTLNAIALTGADEDQALAHPRATLAPQTAR
ncbi:extracellular solute-binding protein [Actinotalea sp. M2MS4P-6]|uniref:extracellular solute-binding protein n=1 Tax=Actinotalea sp. M2MS4P-6 TaxID=2983762 RepID=UPI0021E412EC|nr:extracellular solute-binding protein [Actinotalea sp. M2MS4P-6]MCV2395197.1 extracellular solute-binding protein [Actinotalea sp. M2MS4P-6]